jgi:hypothetical protein
VEKELIQETIRFLSSIEQGNWGEVEAILDPEFEFHSPLHDPVERTRWLQAQKGLKSAFPDWTFHFSNPEQEGNRVIGTVHVTGTHQRELILPLPRFQPIQASGKVISLPVDHIEFKYENHLLLRITIKSPLLNLFAQSIAYLS